MTRSIAAVALLAAALAGALTYQAAATQREYSAFLTRGDNALRDDQTFGAIEAYSGAIALRRDSMLAYLRRGQTYQRRGDRGDLDAAVRDLRRAAALDPTATRPLEALGDALYQLPRYDLSVDAYQRCLRLDDRSPRVTCKLALAVYRNGDADAALASANAAIRLDERMADAHYLRGLCLRDRRQPAAAARAFERAVVLEPAMIPAREELAELYGALGRRSEQLEQLQLLAGLDRDRPARHVAVGMAHARAGHWDLAVLTLGSALERNPNEPEIYRAIGQVWLDRPRDDDAFLSKAREALARAAASPNAPGDTLALYGRALLQSGEIDEAERVLLEATTRLPVEPAAFLVYASAAEKAAHLEPARNALIQYGSLVANDTDFPSRAGRIAALSLRLNDPQTAVAWLTRASAAAPGDLHLLAALADAQFRSGDIEAAQVTLARGLDKEPGNAHLLALKRSGIKK